MDIHTPYEDLLKEVLENGEFKEDRTGTGTISLFGKQMRFDLSESFPLITTKKVAWRSVVGELLWFIQGNTNVNWLKQRGIRIWNEWASEDGSLGPVYGSSWRAWPQRKDNQWKLVELRKDAYADYVYPGDLSKLVVHKHPKSNPAEPFYSEQHLYPEPENKRLFRMWLEMNVQSPYPVSPFWRFFENFAATIYLVPGYAQWSRGEDLVLNCRYYGANCYSPNTVIFSRFENHEETPCQTIYKHDGVLYENKSDIYFPSIDPISGEEEVEVLEALEGHGWVRQRYIDQFQEMIDTLKTNPDSRRIIINSWNVSELDEMALPPCHSMFQFYVSGGKLSCQLYQRSADLFLGVPFNIASYSLLTHMVAKEVGLEVGEFIWTGGDCHIYTNHIDQVKLQLSREPRPYPQLKITEREDIYSYEIGDFTLEGYDPHPTIKGEVAV